MKQNSFFVRLVVRLTLLSGLLFALSELYPQPALAFSWPWRPKNKKPSQPPSDIYIDFTSSGSESSGDRRGMISRGKCLSEPSSQTLQAFLPPARVGITALDNSMAWFYIPHSAEQFRGIKIVVENEEEELWVQSFPQPQKLPGVVGIELPRIAIPQAGEAAYTLRLFVYCVQSGTSNLSSVESVENIKDDRIIWELKRLQTGETWYDDLTLLGKQQCAGNGNSEHWSEFLGLANLEAFKDVPVNCLSTKKVLSESTVEKSRIQQYLEN